MLHLLCLVATVFEFGLRILALFSNQLMQFNDDIDLICALTNYCESLFNFDSLLQVRCFSFLCVYVFIYFLSKREPTESKMNERKHAGESISRRAHGVSSTHSVGSCSSSQTASSEIEIHLVIIIHMHNSRKQEQTIHFAPTIIPTHKVHKSIEFQQ